MLGIYDMNKTETIAQVLKELGLKRAMVVTSHDGLDEISISAPTRVSELRGGEVRTYDIHPHDLGLSVHPMSDILGGDAKENAAIIGSVLRGERSAYRDIVLANAGACIYVSDLRIVWPKVCGVRGSYRFRAGSVQAGATDLKNGEMSYVS